MSRKSSFCIQQGDLVQQTVGGRSSRQTWDGWLVWNRRQEYIQMVFKKSKVPRVFIPRPSYHTNPKKYCKNEVIAHGYTMDTAHNAEDSRLTGTEI